MNDYQRANLISAMYDISGMDEENLDLARDTCWSLADEIRRALIRRAAERDADSERKRASTE